MSGDTPESRIPTARPFRAGLRLAAIGLAVVGALSGTGCAQAMQSLNQLSAPVPASAPTAAPAAVVFDSLFTRDGSVSLSSELAPQLELRLDVWAAEPRRTQEWYVSAPKQFGFAVNVYDHAVDEKAVLTDKRRVYISNVTITSQTAQASGQVQSPFTFSADPRTLVPPDTLRSDRGLLLNSFQGGLLVPEVAIGLLPQDAHGVTLEFAMTVSVEGTANTDSSFQQHSVYQYLPIRVFPDPAIAAGESVGTSGSAGDPSSSDGSWTIPPPTP